MKIEKLLGALVWLLLTVLVVVGCCSLYTADHQYFGLFLAVFWTFVSSRTKCFTQKPIIRDYLGSNRG